MKNLKKALAVVIAMAMVLSTVAFAAAFTDVPSDSPYAEAIELGVALGFFTGYEDGTFKPDGNITRAEFSAGVVRMLGQESQANGAKGKTAFTDVAADNWASGYINIASNLKIVNGYGDGKFGPEDNVTYEQAVKMIIVALGYEPAVGSAGYPVGYLTIAQQNGVTTGVKGVNGVAATRAQVAMLLYNALDVPMMEQTGFGTYIDYVVQDGSGDTYLKTIMTEKLGVVKLKATVNTSYEYDDVKKADLVSVNVQNSYSSKYDDSNYGDGDTFEGQTELKINIGKTNIKDYIGQLVTLYISYDENSDDEPVALYVTKYTAAGNDEVTISSADLDENNAVDVDDKGIATVNYYETSTATKTSDLTIANDANIYINGHQEDTTVSAELDADFYGTATFALVDPKYTGADYDTLYITQYTNVIVDSVNMTSGKVIGKNGSGDIIFKADNTSNSSTLVDKNGKTLDWSTLKENDILSVKKVAGTNVTVNVCTLIQDSVTGTITEVSDDDYTISGKEYKNVSTDTLELDDQGTFYLDILGNIAYFEVDKTVSGNYAYVVKVGNSGDSLDELTQIKMFTYGGEMVSLNTASKVRVSYTKATVTPAVLDDPATPDVNEAKPAVTTYDYVSESVDSLTLQAGTVDTNPYKIHPDMVITYNVNASGVISKIDLPDTTAEGDTDANNFTMYAANTVAADTTSFRLSTNAITVNVDTNAAGIPDSSKRAYITDKTVMMLAPKTDATKTDGSSYDDEDYELVALSALSDDYNDWKEVSVFDVNDNQEAGLVLIQDVNSIDLESGTTGLTVAVKTSTAKNADGDPINKITAFQDGASLVFDTVDDTINTPNGTVFLPVKDVKGALKDYKEIAYIDGSAVKAGTEFNEVNNDPDVDLYLGKVISRSGNKFVIEMADGKTYDYVVPSGVNVYLYDARASKNDTKVTLADDYTIFDTEDTNKDNIAEAWNDETGDPITPVYVLTREYNGKVADMVIYIFGNAAK